MQYGLNTQNSHSGDVQLHVFIYSVMYMNMTACCTLHTCCKQLVTDYRCTMSYAICSKHQNSHSGDVQLHVFTCSVMSINMTDCSTFPTSYKLLGTDYKCTMSYPRWPKHQNCHSGDIQCHVHEHKSL